MANKFDFDGARSAQVAAGLLSAQREGPELVRQYLAGMFEGVDVDEETGIIFRSLGRVAGQLAAIVNGFRDLPETAAIAELVIANMIAEGAAGE